MERNEIKDSTNILAFVGYGLSTVHLKIKIKTLHLQRNTYNK